MLLKTTNVYRKSKECCIIVFTLIMFWDIEKKCNFAFALSCFTALDIATTLWKSDTVRFVFDSLNVGNSLLDQRQMQRWRLRMCILCAAGVCRGLIMPSRTLLVALYILPRVSNLLVLSREASDGLSWGMSSRRYPRSFCIVEYKKKLILWRLGISQTICY